MYTSYICLMVPFNWGNSGLFNYFREEEILEYDYFCPIDKRAAYTPCPIWKAVSWCIGEWSRRIYMADLLNLVKRIFHVSTVREKQTIRPSRSLHTIQFDLFALNCNPVQGKKWNPQRHASHLAPLLFLAPFLALFIGIPKVRRD